MCPELLPGSFVDKALTQHHSDLLFRVPLKTGDQALAYIQGTDQGASAIRPKSVHSISIAE
jgi:hypothetical protein